MAFKTYSEPDTTDTDARIKALFPNAILERGVQYARWLTFPEVKDEAFITETSRALGALGHYAGICLGKPTTALFFCDWFVDSP